MITRKNVRSVLNKHKKRDSWFLDDYSINPYEGCGFNCSYCYIHGSKYGANLSEKIVIKENAVSILDKQLASRARKQQFGYIAVGSATDAYMQVEEEHGLTRKLLQVIQRHRFPVFISTKSEQVIRDLDLLEQIDREAVLPEDLKTNPGRGVILTFSLSSLDEELSGKLEPGAPSPQRRLNTLQQCAGAGFLCGLNAMPLLPFISDTDEELEKIVSAAKKHGAHFILTGSLTLFGKQPHDSKPLYFRFLEKNYPGLFGRYREMYGKIDYPSREYQEDLRKRSEAICKKYKIRNHIR